MIYITGDTHGDWISRLNTNVFPEQSKMTKNDYVIILGDFGIWDNSKKENDNLDWLESRSFTTLFISGNHSNYDILDSLPIKEWHGGKVNFIRPSIIHLRRGQVFNIEDKTFFTFGGASSHDIHDGILEFNDPKLKDKIEILNKNNKYMYRINHISLWKRELPNDKEMQEGLENLKKNNYKVHYILTHSPFTSLLKQMDGGSGLYKTDLLTDYLQEIKQKTDYKYWLFGHMHINQQFQWERAICLYEQITRIL